MTTTQTTIPPLFKPGLEGETPAAAALAFLWLAVLTTLFAKSRRTAVHR